MFTLSSLSDAVAARRRKRDGLIARTVILSHVRMFKSAAGATTITRTRRAGRREAEQMTRGNRPVRADYGALRLAVAIFLRPDVMLATGA